MQLHRHIGLLIVFLHTRIQGDLCRSCLDASFRDAFFVTLLGGWWGLISFFATLFFLPYDLAHYLLTRVSYASPEPPSGSTTRTALSVMAGALPLVGALCGGPYLLLAGLASFFSGITGQPMDQATPAARHACGGVPSPTARAYDAARPPDVLAFRQTDDGWLGAPDFLPEGWGSAGADAAVVVCVDRERTEVVEQCASVDASRVAYPRDVRVVETRTARELGRTTVTGADPPAPCPASRASDRAITLSGARVQATDVAPLLVTLFESGLRSAPPP